MMKRENLPPITLHGDDRERLERLAVASLDRFPQVAEYLVREVERAHVLGDNEDGADFVRMGSLVSYRDDSTSQERKVTLSYPDRADIAAGRISVLTPIGAALIGLSKGQTIAWQSPSGDWRSLTVLSVSSPVEGEHEPMAPA